MQIFRNRGASWVVCVATFVGLVGFFYPFILPAVQPVADNRARATEAPILFASITLLCLLAILLELDTSLRDATRQSLSKTVALLGVLVGADAALRLAPTVMGASPIFLLIILTGAVFGPSFGFQMGVLTLLVSAFITGGVGPWLPFQMLGAGWIGLTAGWIPRPRSEARWIALIAIFAAIWGFLYGALLNLWSWPFIAPGLEQDVGLFWTPSLTFRQTIDHYARYYLVTSLWYDTFRAVGNFVLVIAIGLPIIRTLERFKGRFSWQPWSDLPAEQADPRL
jgi:energy-coupling factor transport system substrate-specific component